MADELNNKLCKVLEEIKIEKYNASEEQRAIAMTAKIEQDRLSKKVSNDLEDEWAKDMPLVEESEKEFKKKQKKHYKECNMLEKHWIKENDFYAMCGVLHKIKSPLKQKLLQRFIGIVCWNTKREMFKLSGHNHPILAATLPLGLYRIMCKLWKNNGKRK